MDSLTSSRSAMVHPFAETILHQKGGRDPMASEESQLDMLSMSGESPVMQD